MKTRLDLSLALGIAAAAVALGAAPARAEDALPPERPTTPYRATVRNTFNIPEVGGSGESGDDTVEIRVSGGRLLVVSKIMKEKSLIVDIEKHEVIQFDPKATDKVAARFPMNETPMPYIQGRAGLAAFNASWPAPKIAGTDTVAKQKCTVLHYGKPGADGLAACVSKQGVVLRAKLVFPTVEREFEVLDFDAGTQDEKWFRPPDGFTVVEGAAPEATNTQEAP